MIGWCVREDLRIQAFVRKTKRNKLGKLIHPWSWDCEQKTDLSLYQSSNLCWRCLSFSMQHLSGSTEWTCYLWTFGVTSPGMDVVQHLVLCSWVKDGKKNSLSYCQHVRKLYNPMFMRSQLCLSPWALEAMGRDRACPHWLMAQDHCRHKKRSPGCWNGHIL